MKLKGVDFNRGIGTLMQGNLKLPKLGGIRRGWHDYYVFLSNARLFICPIVDNSKANNQPVQIIDIRDPELKASDVHDNDAIHANKRDLPCLFKIKASKFKAPDSKQQILFYAKDPNDKNSWINVLNDLHDRLVNTSKVSNNSLGTLALVSQT